MKHTTRLLLGCALILASFKVAAQDTLTTYYITPPTSGCNGIWAFGPYSLLWTCPSAPYQWMFTPSACADTPIPVNAPLNVVGDTILVPLCEQPCSFSLFSGEGECFTIMCQLPAWTSSGVDPDPGASWVMTNPIAATNPFLELRFNDHHARTVAVIDMMGRTMRSEVSTGNRVALDLHGLAHGHYLVRVMDQKGGADQQLFVIE